MKNNLPLLKNELAIARTSFEIAKEYKKIAQNSDDTLVDEKAISPFYIFASFAHLNHCLMSIRKVFFETRHDAVPSLSKTNPKAKIATEGRYFDIRKDINEVIAHMNNTRAVNSIFTISEEKFTKIEKLLDEIADLVNDGLPDDESGILSGSKGALSNVIFGFENLISVVNRGIKNR